MSLARRTTVAESAALLGQVIGSRLLGWRRHTTVIVFCSPLLIPR
jgi:hypothetical protein